MENEIETKTRPVVVGATLHLALPEVLALVPAIPALDLICQNHIAAGNGNHARAAEGSGAGVDIAALYPVSDLLHSLSDWAARNGVLPAAAMLPAKVAPAAAAPAPSGNGDDPPDDHKMRGVHRHWLREQYIDHERSTTDIGRELGVSASTVSKYLKGYGIPARPRRGARPAEAEAETEPDPTPAGASA